VAIGTHDLDTIEAPFLYEARRPKDIRFVPLSMDKEYNAEDLMQYYLNDPKGKHIKEYVSIISGSPVYPIIYDNKQRVLSLPPIINSEHSKISVKTKNIFIECTATDLVKANVVLNTVVCQFSEYCAKPFQVERVKVVYDSYSYETPILDNLVMPSKPKYLNAMSGLSLKTDEICKLATKMMLAAKYDPEKDVINTWVPPTRTDILHPCDIAEDIAIAYGYNNLKKRALKHYTVGKQQPLNHLTEILRHEIAGSRFTEVLTLGLCSRKENYTDLRLEDDGLAVALSNPKTLEYEVCRTSLMPGILKTVRENKALKTKNGIRLFEISDVVRKDTSNPIGASNRRYLTALNMGLEGAGFEIVQGLLDRVMELLAVDPTPRYHACDTDRFWLKKSVNQYELEHGECPTYLQCANIVVYVGPERKKEIVGCLGVVHPEVLSNFELTNPCSMLEMDIEFFLSNKYVRQPDVPKA